MANTYTQLYAHVVFAVKGRANQITPPWKEKLFKYITGIVKNKGQKLIVINGMPDHIHLLVGFRPDVSLSDLVRDIKSNSSRFVNENEWVKRNFEWQKGFGAFTLGYSQLDVVAHYIRNQEEHHKAKTFRDEYQEILNRHDIDYKTEYLFEAG